MTETTAPTLTLWISRYGGWDYDRKRGSMTKVVFTGPKADEVAADYVARRIYAGRSLEETLTFGLAVSECWDEGVENDWSAFPLTSAALNPTCEHGLSLALCAGPGHYPMD